jgi:hypothetical protein
MILKMNFNFNFKDMPGAAGPSIRGVTNVRDPHHTANSRIEPRLPQGSLCWTGQIRLRKAFASASCGNNFSSA